jgi:hypothetical protein
VEYVTAITSLRATVVHSLFKLESIVVSELLFKFEDILLVWLGLASPVVGTLSIKCRNCVYISTFTPPFQGLQSLGLAGSDSILTTCKEQARNGRDEGCSGLECSLPAGRELEGAGGKGDPKIVLYVDTVEAYAKWTEVPSMCVFMNGLKLLSLTCCSKIGHRCVTAISGL